MGRVATGFPEPVGDLETLVRLLREGRCAPLDFRAGGAHGPPPR